jgi:hypothetical protein
MRSVIDFSQLTTIQAVVDHEPLDRSVIGLDRLRCRSAQAVVVGHLLNRITEWYDVQCHACHTPPCPAPARGRLVGCAYLVRLPGLALLPVPTPVDLMCMSWQ